MNNALRSLRRHFRLFGLRGVLRRGFLALSPSARNFKARLPNSSKRVELRLRTTDVAVFEHVFVHEEYDLPLCREPSVIIDAGANVGNKRGLLCTALSGGEDHCD